jgi:hypothetical protein
MDFGGDVEIVARTAIALKALPEYQNTALEALIPVARQFLLKCQIDKQQHDRQQREFRFAQQEEFHKERTKAEAAPYITGDTNADRALKKFEAYEQFLYAIGYPPLSSGGFYSGEICHRLKEGYYLWSKNSDKKRFDRLDTQF